MCIHALSALFARAIPTISAPRLTRVATTIPKLGIVIGGLAVGRDKVVAFAIGKPADTPACEAVGGMRGVAGRFDKSIIVSATVYTENDVPGGMLVPSPVSNNKNAPTAPVRAVTATTSAVICAAFPLPFSERLPLTGTCSAVTAST